ncbi:MAG: acetyl-CoA hydrolase/transferase family protein, partial [Acidimicrobiia bacterium]
MTSRLEQLLRPGELIVAGQVLGEPVALLDELFGLPQRPPGLTLFAGMTLTDTLRRAPSDIDLVSFVGLGVNTELIAAGRMNLVPCQMSTLPGLMSDGPLRPGVAMVVASPPDGDGNCHLGVQADYLCAAVSAARVVVAEINEHVPRVGGDTVVPFERLDGHVRTDRTLPGYERAEPSPVEAAIAARVALNVVDGTCVQIGVGRLGEAVLRAVGDRRHLGVHTGMVGD